MQRRIGSTLAVGLLVVTAGCGSGGARGGSSAAPGTTDESSETPSSVSVASSASSSDASGERRCPGNGGQVPGGAVTAQVIDVDGDRRRDDVWYEAIGTGQRVGLSTTSGSVVASLLDTARPVNGVLVVNADRRGPVEMLVDTGSGIDLLVFHRCDLVPVIGPDDAPYRFDAGYLGNGTGVTCTDADGDGRRDLVGLNLTSNGEITTRSFRLSRTVVELDGATAQHGYHDDRTVRLEPSETNRYYGIRCGSLSLTPEMLTP